jgi:hypothetical protein
MRGQHTAGIPQSAYEYCKANGRISMAFYAPTLGKSFRGLLRQVLPQAVNLACCHSKLLGWPALTYLNLRQCWPGQGLGRETEPVDGFFCTWIAGILKFEFCNFHDLNQPQLKKRCQTSFQGNDQLVKQNAVPGLTLLHRHSEYVA